MPEVIGQRDAEEFAKNWVRENYPKGYEIFNIQKFSHENEAFEIIAQVTVKSGFMSLIATFNPQAVTNTLRVVFNSKGEILSFDKEYGKLPPPSPTTPAGNKK